MRNNKTILYSMLIIIAGIFWGVMGVFVRKLTECGFTSLQVTTIRFSVGVACLAIFMLIYDKTLFKISLKGFLICVAIGVFSCILMSTLYFISIEETSLSVAAILLYTAPVWVVLASVLLYGEKFTGRICIALILAFLGCVFVSGFSAKSVSVLGVLCGLGSGLAYALYSIIGKYALKVCSPYTMTFYSFLVGTVCSIFICDIGELAGIVYTEFSISLLLIMLGTGVVTMFVPFLLYTIGLSKLPAGKASIMATVEPMMATVSGMIFFKEIPSILGFLGIVLILTAVILLNLKED